MLVEVQALVSPTSFGTPRRMAIGRRREPHDPAAGRAGEARGPRSCSADDVFVSVAGGLEVDEPAADLGVAAAVASSFRNRPLPAHTVVFGEVGLAGEVRASARPALRVREAAQMGFTRCILPARNLPLDVPGIQLVGVATLEEALERLSTGTDRPPDFPARPAPVYDRRQAGLHVHSSGGRGLFRPGSREVPLMWLILFRAFVVVLLAHAGYVYSPFPRQPWLGLALGLAAAVGLITLEHKLRAVRAITSSARWWRRHRPLRGAPGLGRPGRARHRRRALRARAARGLPGLHGDRDRGAEGRVVRARAHHRRLPRLDPRSTSTRSSTPP